MMTTRTLYAFKDLFEHLLYTTLWMILATGLILMLYLFITGGI